MSEIPASLAMLPYHTEIVAFLQKEQAELWRWFSSNRIPEQQADAVRLELLKSAYRVDPQSDGRLHELAHAASNRLGLDVPMTLYHSQRSADVMNAHLVFLQSPRRNRARLLKLERRDPSPVEVVTELNVVTETADETESAVNLQIGRRDAEIERPVYLPGYLSWEHLIDHHDPLTDVFSLGLILASLACGLNFSDDGDHRE